MSSTRTTGVEPAQVIGQARDDETGRAASGGVVQEGVAVPLVADDGEEDIADGERAAVDRHARDGHAEVAAHEGALGAADEVAHA